MRGLCVVLLCAVMSPLASGEIIYSERFHQHQPWGANTLIGQTPEGVEIQVGDIVGEIAPPLSETWQMQFVGDGSNVFVEGGDFGIRWDFDQALNLVLDLYIREDVTHMRWQSDGFLSRDHESLVFQGDDSITNNGSIGQGQVVEGAMRWMNATWLEWQLQDYVALNGVPQKVGMRIRSDPASVPEPNGLWLLLGYVPFVLRRFKCH